MTAIEENRAVLNMPTMILRTLNLQSPTCAIGENKARVTNGTYALFSGGNTNSGNRRRRTQMVLVSLVWCIAWQRATRRSVNYCEHILRAAGDCAKLAIVRWESSVKIFFVQIASHHPCTHVASNSMIIVVTTKSMVCAGAR